MTKAIKKVTHFAGGLFGAALSIIGTATHMPYLTAIGLGLSFFSGSQQKTPNLKLENDPVGHVANTKKAGGNIPIIYGRMRVGGNVIYVHSQGSNNKDLYLRPSL